MAVPSKVAMSTRARPAAHRNYERALRPAYMAHGPMDITRPTHMLDAAGVVSAAVPFAPPGLPAAVPLGLAGPSAKPGHGPTLQLPESGHIILVTVGYPPRLILKRRTHF